MQKKFRVIGTLWWESTGHRWILLKRPMAQSFDVLFDVLLNKRLSKQSRNLWFETSWCSLWRHCNGVYSLSFLESGRVGIWAGIYRESKPWMLGISSMKISSFGDETIPDEAPSNRESFYPHESQVSIYHNQSVVDSFSHSSVKNTFYHKDAAIISVPTSLSRWRSNAQLHLSV